MIVYLWALITAIVTAISIGACPTCLAEEPINGNGYDVGKSLNGLNDGTNWDGAWKGSANGLTIQKTDLSVEDADMAGKVIQIKPTIEDLALFRSLKQRLGTDGATIWMSFSIKKDSGKASLKEIEAYILKQGDVTPNVSGRQEFLENLINEFI